MHLGEIMKIYSFYYLGKKYPSALGVSQGKNKKEAFENLKREKGFSDALKLGKTIVGYIHK